jgi:2-polyprenyl-3-methyl-5-hydroxy-6-metoxy-1,4-benzoquinol methylase
MENVNKTKGEGSLRIAVFIVAYNAVATLRKVLDRIPAEVWNQVEEVFVLDDASGDDTVLLGEGYKSARGASKLHVYKNEVNLGYGGNQKKGYRYAIDKGYDYVILLHGDGQYAPEFLPNFIEEARTSRPAAILGSRMLTPGGALKGGMPRYKLIGNRTLTAFQNAILGSRLSEFHTGYRMYAVSVLSKLNLDAYTDDFHFDTQIVVDLLHRGLKVSEIPIPTHYGGEICHVNGLKYAKDVALTVLQYKLGCLGMVRCEWCLTSEPQPSRYPQKKSPLSSHGRIVSMTPSKSRVLDIGAEGAYAKELAEKGCVVTGVSATEPHESWKEPYQRFIVADLDKTRLQDLFPSDRFSCILMADVLEHLRRARQVAAFSKSLLDEHGTVVASTGNVANWYIRLGLLFGSFNYKQRGILDQDHVHLYTRKSFRRLFVEQGYEIRAEKVTPIPFELLAGEGKITRGFWKLVEYFYYALARFWPGMFAYQFILVAAPRRGERQ